ncbi:MAG: hypothetical protein ACYTGQ_18720 [Planctomycetota bacterium]|jgi:hypothetical protein
MTNKTKYGRLLKQFAAMICLCFATTLSCSAASVYNQNLTAADFIGSQALGERTYLDGEIVLVDGAFGNQGNPDPSPSISWVITDTGSEWNYSYTFTDWGTDISHLTIDLTNHEDLANSGIIIDNIVTVTVGTETQVVPDEYGDLDGITGAFKIQIPIDNADEFTLTFDSTNAPMWGDMFFKGGAYEATNRDFGNTTSMAVDGFIAVPDTIGRIPSMPTPAAAGAGLCGFALLGMFRRKRNV